MSRIIDYTETSSAASDDYLLLDGSTNGTRKIKPGSLVDPTGTQSGMAADAKLTKDEINDLEDISGNLLYKGAHSYSGTGNWSIVTITPQTKIAIKLYSNSAGVPFEVSVLLQSWTVLTTIIDNDWHIVDIPSGASNNLTLTYRGSDEVDVSCIILSISDVSLENDIAKINNNIKDLDGRAVSVENGLRQLDINDYLKIYNITMTSNRAIRFVALVEADTVIASVGIKFDYESTDNMQFGTWRVIAYGGNNGAGGVGTELNTFSGSTFQKQFDLSSSVSDANSYKYLQIFIEFVYNSATYTDDIVLNGFAISLNGSEKVLYGCNTWTNSQHTASYAWKSDLIPAYIKKTDAKALREYPQLIISIIDDDTNYCAPTIWGAILENNNDVKIGFACMTAYMNGASTSSEGNTQMTRAQLDAFYNAGHEVYSHGWACYSVRGLTTDELAQECWKSKDWLLKNDFIRGSETLVYSGGTNDDSAKHNIVRGFYKFGVNAWGGGINTDILDNPLYINRVIGDTLTLAQLTSYVDTYLTTGGILVFGFHSYELNKDAENNITKVRDLISYIKNTNAKIVPLERALRSIYGFNVY